MSSSDSQPKRRRVGRDYGHEGESAPSSSNLFLVAISKLHEVINGMDKKLECIQSKMDVMAKELEDIKEEIYEMKEDTTELRKSSSLHGNALDFTKNKLRHHDVSKSKSKSISILLDEASNHASLSIGPVPSSQMGVSRTSAPRSNRTYSPPSCWSIGTNYQGFEAWNV